jgi:hypothetical protein
MRRKLNLILVSIALMGGSLAVGIPAASAVGVPAASAAGVPAAASSIPGCPDWNYACGFRYGFADGRAAKEAGLCESRRDRFFTTEETASERGYRDAYTRYCPA